jgi:signal transduction histidine kinase
MPRGKLLVYLLFTINGLLTLISFISLYESPYTGIRTSIGPDATRIDAVDRGSPAERAGLRAGDILLDVNGLGIPYFAFSGESEMLDSRQLKTFFGSLQQLNRALQIGKAAELSIERAGRKSAVTILPTAFPFAIAVSRVLVIYVVAWTFMIVSFLVLRKKVTQISIANFVFGASVCTAVVSYACTVRDLAYSYSAFRTLGVSNHLGAIVTSISLLHILLVFPQRKRLLDGHPAVIPLLYSFAALIFVLDSAGIFALMGLSGVFDALLLLALVLFISGLIYSFLREKNQVIRKQVQWVVFGLAVGVSWSVLEIILVFFGARTTRLGSLDILPVLVIPFALLFAVTRYKLMEIDEVFDYTVIFTITILVLEVAELCFLGLLAPLYQAAFGRPLPHINLLGVLLIVFLYLPVRNRTRSYIHRLFKRGTYDIDQEIQRFVLDLGISSSNGSAIEKFASFVTRLLGPNGILVVRATDEELRVLIDKGQPAKQLLQQLTGEPIRLTDHCDRLTSSSYGYRLTDIGLFGGQAFPAELEPCLFIPFPVQPGLFYCAVLFPKWNNTAYSRKDRRLLDAISVNVSRILEVEELRRAKAEFEEEMRRQRDDVMKEMHDGLGSVLTKITVTSQVAETLNADQGDKLKTMAGVIGTYSRQAADFLRTGLNVLDDPEREMGTIVSGLRRQAGVIFEAAGINLHFEAEGLDRLKLGPVRHLSLIRCFQEAVNNILKHAGARNVSIKIRCDGIHLLTEIEDDGKGFDPANDGARGFGLRNMAERMAATSGACSVTSALGKGTRLALSMPLALNTPKIPRPGDG